MGDNVGGPVYPEDVPFEVHEKLFEYADNYQKLRVAPTIADYLLAPNQGERPMPGLASMVLRYGLGGKYAPTDAEMEKHGLLAHFSDPFFLRAAGL